MAFSDIPELSFCLTPFLAGFSPFPLFYTLPRKNEKLIDNCILPQQGAGAVPGLLSKSGKFFFLHKLLRLSSRQVMCKEGKWLLIDNWGCPEPSLVFYSEQSSCFF